MKFRAFLFALTMTALLFLPMTAAFGKEEVPKPALPSPEIPSDSSETVPEEPKDSLPESADPVIFRIFDTGEEILREVPAFDYVSGAIAAEMGADFEQEALLAQGIAAYTLALYQKDANAGSDYDFTADPGAKVGYLTEDKAKEIYGDAFPEKWAKITSATEKALKTVVTYGGKPALTVYHAMSAGMTEDAANVWKGSVPYLVAVESPGDEASADFLSTVTVTKARALTLLNSSGAGLSGKAPEEWFTGETRSPSGYVLSVPIGKATFSGAKLRSLFGLRSAAFTVDYKDEIFTFTVKGYGHGVGLSQVGANAMAKDGATAAEILAHYYPGTELTAAGNGAI